MIIKRVRLRNIRSYSSCEITFPSGSVLLAGDIGSGKSSILHAVEFALFGTRRDGLSGDALLRKGERQGEVEMEFHIDGKEVMIKRSIKRSKDNVAQEAGQLTIDGTRHDLTPVEMKAKVLQLLGYPKELLTKSKSLIYRYTVYTPQEEMKQILFENPDSRIDTLRKVFGIEKYKRIVENAQLYAKRVRDDKRALEAGVQDLPLKEKEMKAREDEVEALCRGKKELLDRLTKASEEKKNAEKQLLETEEKVRACQELRNRQEVLETKLHEIVKQRSRQADDITIAQDQTARLKTKLEGIKTDDKIYPTTEEVEQALRSKEDRLHKMTAKKTELIERKNNLIRRLEEVTKDIDKKTEDTTRWRKEEMERLLEEIKDKQAINATLEEAERTIKELEQKITESRTRQEQSRALKDKIAKLDMCPTCEQKVELEHKTKVHQREDRLMTELGEELTMLASKRAKVMVTVAEHKKRIEMITVQEKRVTEMKVEEKNIDTIKQEITKLQEMRKTMDLQKVELMKELEGLDDAMIEELRGEIENKKKELKEIQEHNIKVTEREHILQMIREKEDLVKNAGLHLEELKSRVKEINIEKIGINEDLEKLKDAEQGYAEQKKRHQAVQEEEKRLEVRLAGTEKQIEGAQRMLNMLTEEVLRKKTEVCRIARLGSTNEWIEKMFINLMTTMEKHIMIQIHHQFNELFNQWFSMLIDDENLAVRLDDSFCPVVMQNGHETLVDHLSGGEKTSIALAYRLALNKVVNDIVQEIKTKDLIILDEPTDGFSSEQLDKVREVLEQLNMKQIVIVSHESKIESFVDKVIRVHKSEHVSRVETGSV